MGTRSLTKIIQDEKILTTIYRQFDGYPEGMGLDLANFLNGRKVVNGYTSDDKINFNGMGCLAAQIIKELKKGIGNIYVYPPDAENCWEEFIYKISEKDGQILLECFEVYENKTIFSGTPQEFIDQINK